MEKYVATIKLFKSPPNQDINYKCIKINGITKQKI